MDRLKAPPPLDDIRGIIRESFQTPDPGSLPERLHSMTREMERLIHDFFVLPSSDTENVRRRNPMTTCFVETTWEAIASGREIVHYQIRAQDILYQLKKLESQYEEGATL